MIRIEGLHHHAACPVLEKPGALIASPPVQAGDRDREGAVAGSQLRLFPRYGISL